MQSQVWGTGAGSGSGDPGPGGWGPGVLRLLDIQAPLGIAEEQRMILGLGVQAGIACPSRDDCPYLGCSWLGGSCGLELREAFYRRLGCRSVGTADLGKKRQPWLSWWKMDV